MRVNGNQVVCFQIRSIYLSMIGMESVCECMTLVMHLVPGPEAVVFSSGNGCAFETTALARSPVVLSFLRSSRP